MKIVCISDLHCAEHLLELPEGDILISAGDYDIRNLNDLEYMNRWFGKQDFKKMVIINGNHDLFSEKCSKEIIQSILTNVIYLENSSVTIKGIKIWGSPFTSTFYDWAYMLPGDELKKIWATIPDNTDIIITHGPPLGICDYVEYTKQNVGCPHLRDRIKEIKPKYHIFGHIHCGYGIYQDEHTTYVNASLMNENYDLTNEPIILEI